MRNISKQQREATLSLFETLSFLSEGSIFVYVGLDALDPQKWEVRVASCLSHKHCKLYEHSALCTYVHRSRAKSLHSQKRFVSHDNWKCKSRGRGEEIEGGIRRFSQRGTRHGIRNQHKEGCCIQVLQAPALFPLAMLSKNEPETLLFEADMHHCETAVRRWDCEAAVVEMNEYIQSGPCDQQIFYAFWCPSPFTGIYCDIPFRKSSATLSCCRTHMHGSV